MAQTFKDEGLFVKFKDEFIDKDYADKIFEGCSKLNWPNQIKPRRTSITFGDDGLIYTIRVRDVKIHRYATSWNKFQNNLLILLKNKIEKCTKLKFNFCAILRYEHGGIFIQKHKDKEMLNGTTICGISVGDTRKFQLSSPYNLKRDPVCLELTHGSIYLMYPPTNSYWSHEILPDEHKGMRYSLTFRNIPIENLVKEIPIYPKCKTLLKTGNKKGQECGANIKILNSETCKRHIK